MAQTNLMFIGIKGTVLALDRATGREAWRQNLPGVDFVNVVVDGTELYATTRGEIFRLDPATGRILWNNDLKGLGRGLATLAVAAGSQAIVGREKQKREEQNAAPMAVPGG